MMQEEFVAKILEVLSPMPDVSAIKAKGHIVLYKGGVMFGKIIKQNVLLLTPTVVKDSILAIGVTKVYHHGFDN
jgi:hypothetical protein